MHKLTPITCESFLLFIWHIIDLHFEILEIWLHALFHLLPSPLPLITMIVFLIDIWSYFRVDS